jgi:cytochrome c-type biogenesis protein
MMSSLFFGGSMMAALIAGAIALFAPCCIAVMLPAYFASSFQNRRVLSAMTLVFAAGIATIVLPIALGASLIRQLLTAQHTVIYTAGGLLMLILAVYVLLGGMLHLPMPSRQGGYTSTGVLSVYTLGLFSGITSSCCAPVLAGVNALSSVASSFVLALGLGTAYVFGMVAPLAVIALLWKRYDWRRTRLFRPRTFTWRVGSLTRQLTTTNLASGLLLLFIGGGMIWAGVTENSMPQLSGWQADLVVTLQHIGQVLTHATAWMPNWLAALLVLLALGGLAWFALKQTGILIARPADDEASLEEPDLASASSAQQEEETIEQ